MIDKLYIGWWYDVMHSGHKDFIKKSVEHYAKTIERSLDSLTIWLNSDEFLNNKKWSERPFFSFDWRKIDMERYLQTLWIWEVNVVDEEDIDLWDFKVVVCEWWPMQLEWKDLYDLLPVSEIWGQHTSSIKKELDDAKASSLCKMKQVGAVLIRQWSIITSWFNGANWNEWCAKEHTFYSDENEWWKNNLSIGVPCNSPHAEIVAIKDSSPWDDLIISLSPCMDCAIEIVKKWIRRVVYLEEYYNSDPGLEILQNWWVQVRKAWV